MNVNPLRFKTKLDKAMADTCQQQSLFEWEDGLHKPSEVPSNPYFYDSTHLSNISLLYPVTIWLRLLHLSYFLSSSSSMLSAPVLTFESPNAGSIHIVMHLQPKGCRETWNHWYLPKNGCQVAGWVNKLYAFLVHK